MSMEFSQISVPLGGGLQQSVHRWKVKPPGALEVRNMHLRKGESLTKRKKAEPLVNAGSGVSPILVPQHTSLALLNDSGAHVVKASYPSPRVAKQEFGGHIPTEVLSHPVLALRGAVSGPQIAVNPEYIGIVFQEADYSESWEDAEEGTGGGPRQQATVVVLDHNFEIVFGPERIPPSFHTALRIEPLGTGFLIFGTNRIYPSLFANRLFCYRWQPGVGLTFHYSLTESVPNLAPHLGPTSLAVHRTDAKVNLLYDTYASEDAVYVCWRTLGWGVAEATDHVPGILYVHKLPVSGSPTFRAVEFTDDNPIEMGVNTVQVPMNNDAIWYDDSSDTVAIYSGHTRQIYTFDGALSSTSPLYASPPTSLPFQDTPVFYRKAGATMLNEREISFLGGASRQVGVGEIEWNPTIFSPDGDILGFHRRPQPNAVWGAYYFRDFAKYKLDTDFLVKGDACVYATDFTFLPGGHLKVDARIVAPLSTDRLPLWRMWYVHGTVGYGPEAQSEGGRPPVHIPSAKPTGVLGQTAMLGDSILLANFIANAAYLPPPLQNEESPRVSASPNYMAPMGAVGGAGVYEGTEQLVVTEIKTRTPNYSYVDYYGSTLVAAGALTTFDGEISLPATIDPPKELLFFPNGYPSQVISRSPFISFTHQFRLEPEQKVHFKGVLVYVDRNGVKYRSAPFDIGEISNISDGPRMYLPELVFDLTETHKALCLAGRKLLIEVYTSDVLDVKDESPSVEHRLMFRGAVRWDGTDYATDMGHIFPPKRNSSEGFIDAWNFNPTPLYTDTGELVPVSPPASNVLAQAGNYMFLAPSEDPYSLRFSKPLDARIGPEFNPLLSINMPSESGGIVSLSGESDRLVLLCKSGVWELFVGGEGPDMYGNGAFPPFRKLWGGEGCLTHRGTVSGTFGTFFVSESGPKIVGRDGSVTDVSRDLGLSDFSSLVRAVHDAASQEIWLFMQDGAYVFDLVTGQWTSSSTNAMAAVVKSSNIIYLDAETKSLCRHRFDYEQELPGDIDRHGKYVSPWLSLSGPLDYKRVQEIGVLIDLPRGEATGKEGGIRVSIAYDYKDVEVDVREWHLLDMLDLDLPVQLKVRPTKQKADAYRITVEEFGTGGYSDDNEEHPDTSDLEWSLVDISLHVAAKGGLVKLQAEAKK